jgi:hypothetical protein
VEFVRFTNRALHIHGQATNGEGGRTDARPQAGRATALLKTNGNTHGNNPTTIRHYDNNNNNNNNTNNNNSNDPTTQHQPNNNSTTLLPRIQQQPNNNSTPLQTRRRATALHGCNCNAAGDRTAWMQSSSQTNKRT